MAPGSAHPQPCCSSPAARSRVGEAKPGSPQSLGCPKTHPGGRLPATMRQRRSFCPFSWERALLPRCPCLLRVAPTGVTASPGDRGGCTQAPGWGKPSFPPCTPARLLIAAVLQANSPPSRPAIAHLYHGSERARCAFSSDSFAQLFVSSVFLFFFLSRAHTAEAKRLLCPTQACEPPPSPQKRTAEGMFQTE